MKQDRCMPIIYTMIGKAITYSKFDKDVMKLDRILNINIFLLSNNLLITLNWQLILYILHSEC